MTEKVKLDLNNPAHQLLVGTFAMIVEDFGYTPRELFVLIEETKRQTFHALSEISKEADSNA